jgi:hypothetical protein
MWFLLRNECGGPSLMSCTVRATDKPNDFPTTVKDGLHTYIATTQRPDDLKRLCQFVPVTLGRSMKVAFMGHGYGSSRSGACVIFPEWCSYNWPSAYVVDVPHAGNSSNPWSGPCLGWSAVNICNVGSLHYSLGETALDIPANNVLYNVYRAVSPRVQGRTVAIGK